MKNMKDLSKKFSLTVLVIKTRKQIKMKIQQNKDELEIIQKDVRDAERGAELKKLIFKQKYEELENLRQPE